MFSEIDLLTMAWMAFGLGTAVAEIHTRSHANVPMTGLGMLLAVFFGTILGPFVFAITGRSDFDGKPEVVKLFGIEVWRRKEREEPQPPRIDAEFEDEFQQPQVVSTFWPSRSEDREEVVMLAAAVRQAIERGEPCPSPEFSEVFQFFSEPIPEGHGIQVVWFMGAHDGKFGYWMQFICVPKGVLS